jgi:hypothetical protein
MKKLWNNAEVHERWLVGLALLVAAFCLLASKIFADGVSQIDYNAPMTLRHYTETDSGRAIMTSPDGNVVDTILLLPITADSTVLRADTVALDSTGTYAVTAEWYERGAGAVSGADSFLTWVNVSPIYYVVTGGDTVSATDKVCVVVINVLGSDGQGKRGVRCSAYPAGRNLKDSAGAIVSTARQTERSDEFGRLIFNCLWSSYIVPATEWRFQFQGSDIEALSFNYTVPRQTADTIELGDLP